MFRNKMTVAHINGVAHENMRKKDCFNKIIG